MAVAAARQTTVRNAGIREIKVAVVAFLDAEVMIPIAAYSATASGGTGVRGISVAVIALLARFWVYAPVAAALDKTSRRTIITADQVAIVTFLTLAGHAITATGRCAGVGAIIGVDAVAVITTLTRVDASVAADFGIAVFGAAVARDVVGVVTFFVTGINKPVAAGR
jgi:hypothetical protein